MSSLKILISSLEYSIAQIYRCLKQISRPLGHLALFSPKTISLSRTSTSQIRYIIPYPSFTSYLKFFSKRSKREPITNHYSTQESYITF